MLLIIKIALTFFVMAFIMAGLAGLILFYDIIRRLNSTIRSILYIGIITISLVTICFNFSYMGIPYIVFYIAGFILIGFCSFPIKLFMRKY